MSPSRARTFIVLLLVAASGLALPGCGGGGGGGDSTSGGLTFTADKSSISFNFDQNQVPPPQTVAITTTGQYTGTLYLAATVSGSGHTDRHLGNYGHRTDIGRQRTCARHLCRKPGSTCLL